MSDLVPEGWSNTIFGELTESIKSGLSRRIVAQDIGIPVLISGNIQNNILDTNEFKYWYVNDPQGADTSRYLLNDGDILLCFINSMAQIGKVCIYRDIGRPAIYTTNLFRVVANLSCSPVFVYQLMTYQTFQEEIQLITKPAVNQASFTKGDLVEIPVKLPPLPEQQKIAAILSSVDDVIEKTQAQIEKLKDLKTGMMQELLSPREPKAGDQTGAQASKINGLHHTEFKDSPLGRIPVGWEVVILGNLIKSMDGGVSVNGENRQKTTSEIGVLKVSSVFKGKFLPNNHKAVIKEDEARVKLNPIADRILFSRANTPELVGESGYIEKDYKDLFLPDKIWMIDVKDRTETHVKWLSYVLCSGHIRKTIADVATGTSGSMKNISKPNLLGIRVALPSFSEQVRIAAAVQSVDDNLYLTIDKLEHTKCIKKALMQDLLTGKVRVNT